MRTNRAVTRPSSEPVSMRPIVDRQTPVKTLPSFAVGNKLWLQVCVRIGLHISFPENSLTVPWIIQLHIGVTLKIIIKLQKI